MPRAVRKSVSRCSSRSSSRSSCRKRQNPRDSVLSSIREALRSSSGNRGSPFMRERAPMTPTIAPAPSAPSLPAAEATVEKVEQTVATPKQPEPELVLQKPAGLFQHGIRYIMLPLHLLHLCVWGSPSATPSEPKETKTASSKSDGSDKKSSSRPGSKNSTPSSSGSSKASSSSASSSGFSSSSSSSSRSSRIRPASLFPPTSDVQEVVAVSSATSSASSSATSSTSSSATSSATSSASSSATSSATSSASSSASSSSTRKNVVPRRILREETTDYSSDEMVTAAEELDDSSNDQWSNAVSSPLMNMSIDFESHSNIDKVSSSFSASCVMEEPMDVSMEESSFFMKQSVLKSPSRSLRASAIRAAVDRRSDTASSSSSNEDHSSVYRESPHSSVDREIASIFQRACTSSSSDDEDYGQSNGRRNNPFLSRSSNFGPMRSASRFREEISDAAIRKKRTSSVYDRLPEAQAKRANRGSSASRGSIESSRPVPVDLSKIREKESRTPAKNSQEVVVKAGNQTDSAYSDEDVEMNSINESIIRLQSVHMQSLQESVVEWMDQDLDYVADTEDSNDGSPLPGRARNPSTSAVSTASADLGFVERESRQRDVGMPLGEWKNMSGLDRSVLEGQGVAENDRSASRNCNKIPEMPNSMVNAQIAPRERGPSSGDWKNSSGLQGSIRNAQIASREGGPSSGHLKKSSGLQGSMINGQIAPRVDGPPSGEWKNSSAQHRPLNGQIPVQQGDQQGDLVSWQKTCGLNESTYNAQIAGRGPPGFPEAPQHQSGTSCHCGKPNCFYVPLAMPAGPSDVNWTRNYTKPPSPLRHLYYDYPEFMSPPAEASTGGQQSPFVLIPLPANLLCQELA